MWLEQLLASQHSALKRQRQKGRQLAQDKHRQLLHQQQKRAQQAALGHLLHSQAETCLKQLQQQHLRRRRRQRVLQTVMLHLAARVTVLPLMHKQPLWVGSATNARKVMVVPVLAASPQRPR